MTYIKWDEPDIGREERNAVLASIETGWVGSNGPLVRQFEQEFAAKVGAGYAIAVNNGTSALMAALYAFRAKMGNLTVAVPAFTFIASANTACEISGDIRLIDCNPHTWNIEKALVPDDIDLLMTVDVGGLSCDYESLRTLGVPIIADSAESTGAQYRGRPVGTQADVHCFSFHRAKTMTTGEGGMITTNDEALYETMRALANHGYAPERKPWEYRHSQLAFNFRMTELEAAVGIAQLKKLDRYVTERRRKAAIYREIIGDLAEYQAEPVGFLHSYFFFGMLIGKGPGWFCREMQDKGIEVKTWSPVHVQKHYQTMNARLPNAENVANRLVLLPIHNKLGEDAVTRVAETARRLLKC